MSLDFRAFLLAAACLPLACTMPTPPGSPPGPPAYPGAPGAAPQPPTQPQTPVSPQARQQAQRGALVAVELLDAGHEAQAVAELQRALAADPGNRLAHNLLRQVRADPVALLGAESFDYTLQASDTLSRVAERYLDDVFLFYILARYNHIQVPRQVAGGQVIRVPSRGRPVPPPLPAPPPPAPPETAAVPAASAAPEPAPPAAAAASEALPPPPSPPPPPSGEPALRSAQAAERAGNLELALTEYERAALLAHADAPAGAERVRRQLVARHTASARGALARQDLDGSIRQWDRVLEFDPSNTTARLERQRAQALKAKVETLK